MSGDAHVCIERGKGQASALCELNIGGIVRRETSSLRNLEDLPPGSCRSLVIKDDWERSQILQGCVTEGGIDALAPLRHQKRVGNFKGPVQRCNGAALSDCLLDPIHRIAVGQAPGQSDRAVDDDAGQERSRPTLITIGPPFRPVEFAGARAYGALP